MKSKIFRGVASSASICFVLAALAACREEGRPDPSVQMAVSHDADASAAPAAAPPAPRPNGGDPLAAPGENAKLPQPVPATLLVPDAVKEAYTGVRLGWKSKADGRAAVLDLAIGESAPVPGSALVVRADAYLPAFDMTATAITSAGVDEQNPAAHVTVTENGAQVFSGWLFRRFPDAHPFTHPGYTLNLVGSIRRGAPS